MRTTLVAIVILLIAQFAPASQEGVLPFSEFTVHSAGIGESGGITVEGLKGLGSYKKLVVKAFGKTIEVSKELLEKIPRYQNGIQLSYERGYEVLGGRTVYITFLSGFTSGIRERLIISVPENGQPSILKTP